MKSKKKPDRLGRSVILLGGPEVERIRQVRREIAREFKTFDAYADYIQELDRQHWARLRKQQQASKTKRTPTKSTKAKRAT